MKETIVDGFKINVVNDELREGSDLIDDSQWVTLSHDTTIPVAMTTELSEGDIVMIDSSNRISIPDANESFQGSQMGIIHGFTTA